MILQQPSDEAQALIPSITVLLGMAGLDGQPTITPMPGGGNNRAYRVEMAGRRFFLKQYFQHPDDPRDRLNTEFTFCRFAWDHGLRWGPQPIGRVPLMNLGLYEFIPGQPLTSNDLQNDHRDAALQFVLELNRHRSDACIDWPEESATPKPAGDNPSAGHVCDDDRTQLPLASEACFSLEDHLGCVDRRLSRLLAINPATELERQAQAFIQRHLSPAWDLTRRKLVQAAESQGFNLVARLPADRCWLSPSDFGFHNALRPDKGSLAVRFLDFEYAGWDDPAKLVCDFFTQVAVPVPLNWLEHFAQAVAQTGDDPDPWQTKVRLLLPAYRFKWCCLTLNEFLPQGLARRTFAQRRSEGESTGNNPAISSESWRARQLKKAEQLLQAAMG